MEYVISVSKQSHSNVSKLLNDFVRTKTAVLFDSQLSQRKD